MLSFSEAFQMKGACVKFYQIPILALLVIIIFSSFTYTQAPDTLWTKTFGGGLNEYGNSIQLTLNGEYIIAGRTSSFGAGSLDVYLIKADDLGNAIWTKVYGGIDEELINSVQLTADSGYILAGRTSSFGAGSLDVYILRTNSLGDTSWTRTYGGTDTDIARYAHQTSDNGFICAAFTHSFGAGGFDIYLLKMGANGDTVWTKTYGGTGDDEGRWVEQTPDGGYILTGFTGSYGAGGSDVWLIKTDSLGNIEWSRTYGGADDDNGNVVKQTSDGGYIISGWTKSFGAGHRDVYLIKTNANGDTSWTKVYGGPYRDFSRSIQETSDGGFIVGGGTKSFGAGERDVYILRTNPFGDTIWTRIYGGTDFDQVNSILQTVDSGYTAVGWTGSIGAGGYDLWLMRLGPDVGIDEQDNWKTGTREWDLTCSPNPFCTQIKVSLVAEPGNLSIGEPEIRIYDVAGRRVRDLILYPSSFILETTWDGRDEQGKLVSPGIYFVSLDGSIQQKVVKIK
jgi:hypothetical protein